MSQEHSRITVRDLTQVVHQLDEVIQISARIKAARMIHILAVRMVEFAEGDSEKLQRECKTLLDHQPKFGLTPATMADRMTRIAKLPQSHHINSEGRVYVAAIENPLGDGSVWCAVDITENVRKDFECIKREKAGAGP